MSPAQERLAGSIAELYRVFARYPLRSSTEPCEHCHAPGEEHALHAKPLRELTRDELGAFAFDALTTWGSVDDFKHFLPRIFEIVGEGRWPDIEVVFGKLRYADWRDWPADEIAAVEAYLRAKWEAALEVFPGTSGGTTSALLCAVGQSVDDLSPFLGAWLEASGEAPARNLAVFVREEGLANAFWAERSEQQAQVRRWMHGQPVLERLTVAFFASQSDEVQRELSVTIETLELLGFRPSR